MAATGGVPCITIFQEARNRIESHINSITQSLHNKQIEMFAEIASLEKEFTDKQQQKYKDLNKLDRMRAKTEEELGDNSLIGVQQRVLQELQMGIEELTVDIDNTREPDYYIEIKWGMCMESLLTHINESRVDMTQLISPTPHVLQRKMKWKQKVTIATPNLICNRQPQLNYSEPIDWEDSTWSDYPWENETLESVGIAVDPGDCNWD